MKSIVLLFLLFISIPPVWAQDSSGNADPKTEIPPREESSSGDSATPPVPWPKPFKPSEEIGADSQISFPTDI